MRTLHADAVAPFDEGYQGDRHGDYVGRAEELAWPDDEGCWGGPDGSGSSRYSWHEGTPDAGEREDDTA